MGKGCFGVRWGIEQSRKAELGALQVGVLPLTRRASFSKNKIKHLQELGSHQCSSHLPHFAKEIPKALSTGVT